MSSSPTFSLSENELDITTESQSEELCGNQAEFVNIGGFYARKNSGDFTKRYTSLSDHELALIRPYSPLIVAEKPEIIHKKPLKPIKQTQNLSLKFLRPPTPDSPSNIVAKKDRNVQAKALGPIQKTPALPKQDIVIERWAAYKPRASKPAAIQKCLVMPQVQHVNPVKYAQKTALNIIKASTINVGVKSPYAFDRKSYMPSLYGDLNALTLINSDANNLGYYKNHLTKF